MEDIMNSLEKLNFTKTEGLVYITILKYPSMTGYQIAKKINLSRSSVYSALENLYKRGIVSLLPGETNSYKAQNPDVLIENMKKDFLQSADELKEKLADISRMEVEERYMNIEGYDNIITKTKEMLLTAEQEVYMNTDFDLQVFTKELDILEKHGVRVIAFSFSDLNTEGLKLEMYTHGICESACGGDTRMMLVVDNKRTLIGSTDNHVDYVGTFTDNRLLAAIVSEHIHHDIYILKLNRQYGKDVIDDQIKLGTLLEGHDPKKKRG